MRNDEKFRKSEKLKVGKKTKKKKTKRTDRKHTISINTHVHLDKYKDIKDWYWNGLGWLNVKYWNICYICLSFVAKYVIYHDIQSVVDVCMYIVIVKSKSNWLIGLHRTDTFTSDCRIYILETCKNVIKLIKVLQLMNKLNIISIKIVSNRYRSRINGEWSKGKIKFCYHSHWNASRCDNTLF